MSDEDIVVAAIVEDAYFTVEQFCAVCSTEQDWIIHHVQEGLFPISGAVVSEWRFSTADLRRARRMRDIEREFEAAPELAALVADMLEEIDALRARLRRLGK